MAWYYNQPCTYLERAAKPSKDQLCDPLALVSMHLVELLLESIYFLLRFRFLQRINLHNQLMHAGQRCKVFRAPPTCHKNGVESGR